MTLNERTKSFNMKDAEGTLLKFFVTDDDIKCFKGIEDVLPSSPFRTNYLANILTQVPICAVIFNKVGRLVHNDKTLEEIIDSDEYKKIIDSELLRILRGARNIEIAIFASLNFLEDWLIAPTGVYLNDPYKFRDQLVFGKFPLTGDAGSDLLKTIDDMDKFGLFS